MTVEDRLRQAIALSKNGNNIEARKMLEGIVHANPEMDIAWIWLANTYPTNPERIAVLEEWLKQNPKNENAKSWLSAYKDKKWSLRKPKPEPSKLKSGQIVELHGDENIPVLVRRSDLVRSKRQQNKKKRPFLIPGLAGGLIVLLGLGFLIVRMIQGQGSRPVPTPIISPTSMPATSFSTPSSTPSITPIQTPALTATASSTPAPVLTDTPSAITATVDIGTAYLYAGPSASHPIVLCNGMNCVYPRGTQVTLMEQHSKYSDTWFLVNTPDGKTGWMFAGWLLISGDTAAVPTAAAIPTYPANPTP
jgi:hypothetical protein